MDKNNFHGKWSMCNKNQNNKIHRIILVFLGTIVLSCVFNFQSPERGEILFADDFQSSNTFWRIWFEENVSAASVIEGEMVMILEKSDSDIVTTNHITHPNVEISVDVVKEHGSENNIFGVVCRYVNPRNYYSFLVSSDGYYGIAKKKNGVMQLISSQQMQYDAIINKENQPNTISVICNGEFFQFTVNGKELASLTDDDLAIGGNGLVIGSFEAPGDLVVAFDNFRVLAQ